MNRFMKFLILSLLLAPLLTGCSSTRFTSSIKKQDFNAGEEVKFNIKKANVVTEVNAMEGQRIKPIYRNELTLELLRQEAKTAYPDYFTTEADAIPLELDVKVNYSENSWKQFFVSWASLNTIPSTKTIKTEVELDIEVTGEDDELLLKKSSGFSHEAKNWITMFSPLGLIPIPGKSDIPKFTKVDGGMVGYVKPGAQFLRRSIIDGIVKGIKGSDMKKVVASYQESKRLAEADTLFQERLLQGAASSAAMEEAMDRNSLVLMPLRASGVAAANRPAMESAIASSLSNSYKVYSGKRVTDKVREIYSAATAKAKAGEECDDTMCMQDIGISFQSELVASANVLKNPTGYILTLNITNVFDDVLVMSESITCKGCDEFQVIERLKTISDIY
ncbi:MAG: hypothetical protein IMF07_05270 [Proteobacteria bacterium]|nr:hypothetical protein [Pseudomonadota bacterium]